MKKQIKFILVFFCLALISSKFSFSQVNNVRGMYVKSISSWLGNATLENEILNYAQGNAYTYICFYDLSGLSYSNTTVKNNLASFIRRAKTQYGITEVGAATEIYSFVRDNIIPYNNSRSLSTEKFDVLNFEFEFWVSSSISTMYCNKYLTPNGYSCDTAGAYKFSKSELRKIDSLAAAHNMISEMYLGWPNRGQMQDIANTVDRILLHAYRQDDSDVYQYSRNRLIDIASTNRSVKVISLFSSESSFMGPWLANNPLTKPYQTYSNYYAAETGSWKQYINLQGYHWFTYSTMPKTTIATASISASGPTTFCTGGSVTLSANSGSNYLWSPGGQTTQSIVVSSSGSYTVRVTNSSGLSATSSPVNVTVGTTMAAPVISASGSTSFCAGGSVTLTSSSASTYLWSNGATTQSINVTTAGVYTVQATSGTCTAVSLPTTVSVTSPPPVPIITANGPFTICPGTSLTLSSPSAGGYLWSTGATTQSITVSSAGTYWVRNYSSGNCFSQSANKVVSVGTAPSVPTITTNGSLNLCSGSTVTFTSSSSSNGYLWSNGATTQSITVNTSGTYWVRTFNSSGCHAQSANQVVTNGSAPATPVITASGSLNICQGNSVTLSSSSASSYLWSNGATSQSITVSTAGTYWVRVFNSSSSCYTQSANTVVNTNAGPPTPVISVNGSLSLCPGNTTTLSSSSASGYLWSTGATTQSIDVTAAGTYWVRAYSSGSCYTQSPNTVISMRTAPATPTVSASGALHLTSTNPTVTLTSSSSNSYSWNTGASTQAITVSDAGTYQVTITGSSGCSATSVPVVVTKSTCTPPPIPTIVFSGSNYLLPGDSVTLTSSTANGYLWSTGATTQSITVSAAGTYSVRVYSGGNCFTSSSPVNVYYSTTGIGLVSSNQNELNFTMYPNPAKQFAHMNFTADKTEKFICRIIDMTGKEIITEQINAVYGDNTYILEINPLSSGIYFVNLTGSEHSKSIRLIVE
ncbi:MAG: T9SS C-terminal target domain-containing protein [Bacteroidetes bacterium]|nr:MAG: T9SS C-terminal target domain-containing protein [Bacteroidota bacterium]REJ99688.1 MAG: T9SS C-terminal target domain-containing protein [Bacteroidota bacterium]REK33921.1 MAG: T9SS C-terminal target domain-containing protein [Bacteroidota bacterium]REK47687.1 MAG: T9SS C-terminal target domain-containing protein [Bacteroidota bacterium]